MDKNEFDISKFILKNFFTNAINQYKKAILLKVDMEKTTKNLLI